MRHCIFFTSILLIPIHAITAMEDTSKENPCITIINNGPKKLYMEVGNLEKDNIKSRMVLQNNVRLTFSPYAHPFFLNKEHMHEGTTITFFTEHPADKKENTKSLPIHIGGISKVQFGNVIQIMYEKDELTADNIPTLDFDRLHRTKKPQKTLKIKKRLTKRSHSVS